MTGDDKNNLGKKSTRIEPLRLKPPVFHFTCLLAQKTDGATLWHIPSCFSSKPMLSISILKNLNHMPCRRMLNYVLEMWKLLSLQWRVRMGNPVITLGVNIYWDIFQPGANGLSLHGVSARFNLTAAELTALCNCRSPWTILYHWKGSVVTVGLGLQQLCACAKPQGDDE